MLSLGLAVAFFVGIISMLFISFDVNVKKERITSEIEKRIPMTIKKDVKVPLIKPIHTSTEIQKVKTLFKDGSLAVDIQGVLSTPKQKYQFTITADTNVELRDGAFYLIPVKDSIHTEVNSLNQTTKRNKLIGAMKKTLSAMGGVVDTDRIINKIASVSLSRVPVYKLKDDKLQGAIRASLKEVKITKDGITAKISLAKIGLTIILMILGFLFLIALLVAVIYNPSILMFPLIIFD